MTPKRHPPARGTRSRRGRGLSIAELIISLAIAAVLLTAVAAAFTASSSAVEMNEQFFRASNAARVTMNQLSTEIRRADSVQVSTAGDRVEVIRPEEDMAANEVSRTFRYDAANRRVTLQITYAGNRLGPVYTMTGNVTAARFGPPEPGTDAEGRTVVARVPITLTVAVGDNLVTLNGAAGPRRALPN